MNPSSATDVFDDATSKKLTRHSRRLGYGGLFLLNVMDYRATDPNELPPEQERSDRNLHYIRKCAQFSEHLIVAYGALQKKNRWREFATESLRQAEGLERRCVSLNQDHTPRHPRRFPAIFELRVFGEA
jgi:hypothetical protein